VRLAYCLSRAASRPWSSNFSGRSVMRHSRNLDLLKEQTWDIVMRIMGSFGTFLHNHPAGLLMQKSSVEVYVMGTAENWHNDLTCCQRVL